MRIVLLLALVCLSLLVALPVAQAGIGEFIKLMQKGF